jgi:hypothetical protein
MSIVLPLLSFKKRTKQKKNVLELMKKAPPKQKIIKIKE